MLAVSTPAEGELAPGESRSFAFDTEAGSYVRLRVDQQGIDLGVELLAPDGESLGRADGPGGRFLDELLSAVVEASGRYRVELAPRPGEPAAGRYRITLEAARPVTAGDALRVRAEGLYSRGRHLGKSPSGSDRREALVVLAEALALWERLADAGGLAVTLEELGRTHRRLGDPRAALGYYRRALPFFEVSGDVTGQADAHHNIGLVSVRVGEAEAALASYRRALELQAELGDDARQAATLNAVARIHAVRGELRRALETYDRSLALRRAAGDLRGEGITLDNQGSTYFELGEVDEAAKRHRRALEIARRLDDPAGEMMALFNLAVAYRDGGDLQRVLDHFSGARDIAATLGDRRMEQRSVAETGLAYLSLGEPGKALELLERALALSRVVESPEEEALTLLNLGWAYEALERFDEARGAFEEALTASAATGMRRRDVHALHGLGRAYREQGQPDRALEVLGRALALSRELGQPAGEVVVLRELAEVQRVLGRAQAARELFEQALSRARELEDPLREAAVRAGLARTLKDLGRLAEARVEIERSLELTSGVRAAVASPDLRSSFRARRFARWELYVELLMALDARRPGQGLAAEALAASERARARGLVELLAEAGIEVRAGIASELREKERAASQRLSAIQGRLIRELSRSERDAARVAFRRAQLEAVRTEHEEVLERIRREHGGYARVHDPRPLDLAGIQNLLDDRTAFLEILLAEERSFLFVVTRGGLESYELAPAPEIASRVERFRAASRRPGRSLRGQLVESSESLYRLLVEPAAERLAEVDRLLIAPDRELYYLPFEALLDGSGRYLIERWAVAYVPSATALAGLDRPRPRAPDAPDFVGFGAGSLAGPDPAGPWRPLPGAAAEVRAIAELYPARAAVYLDADAREDRVQGNPRVAGARHLHFATHGILDDRRPAYSGLLLGAGESGDDGLLQVHEIFDLELSADLVVLSACDTGVGKHLRGEGLIGLSRAFLYAGAPSLVVSLWPVADDSTAELMLSFYRHLREARKAEALRAAKLELIAGGKYSHPFYWAPFVLVGDPG